MLKSNIEKEQSVENEGNISEDDELIMKIYQQNIDKITLYSDIMKYSQLAAYICMIITLVLLSLKLSDLGSFSYLYFIIPISLTIASSLLYGNIIFRLKSIIDKTEITLQKGEKENENGSLIIEILLNFTGISLFIFFIVLFCRLDGYIDKSKDLNIIFIPLYLSLISCLIFGVFISPGFFKGEMYFEIGLTFIHLVSLFTFFFLLCYKVNMPHSIKYIHVYVPYYFSAGAQLLYFIGYNFFDKKQNNIKKQILFSFSMSCVLCAGIINQIFLDANRKDIYYIPVILYLAAFLGFTSDQVIDTFNDINDEKIE